MKKDISWLQSINSESNELCTAPFWIVKPIFLKVIFINLKDTILLFINFWTLCKRSIASGAKKSKVSKVNGMKHDFETCFLMFYHFICTNFKRCLSRSKTPVFNLTTGESLVKCTQTCFSPIHPYTRTSDGLSFDLPSHGSIKKFTGVYFFIDISTRRNISNMTSLTRSCRYLKLGSSLQ